MPNNYTVNNYTATEAIGDNVSDGTFPNQIQMTITPNAGYGIQASDFSLGSDGVNGNFPYYPIGVVSAVSFSDSVTPLDPLNNVIVTLTMASIFEFDGSVTGVELDIDGNAHLLTSTVNFVVSSVNATNVTATQQAHGGNP
tara:strand:- start:2028 stop:2450 length:423 start_codon:yes stop_codon:yes gene_type:complete